MRTETQPLFIGGEWVRSASEFAIHLPYDGTEVGRIHSADEKLLDRAVEAARAAAPVMAEMSNAERSDLLLRVHGILARQVPEMAAVLCRETGKPLKEARVEAERSLQTLLTAAMEARFLHGEAVPIDGAAAGKGRMAMTLRQPRGVIGAITPFNLPLNLAMHKIAPALASGNTVVHKPAEETPLSGVFLARALEEAGAPKGAYNLIASEDGERIGGALVRHPGVAMITFTGSVPVGKAIRANAGLKKVTLELGGNSALVVEPDADLDVAVSRTIPGAFSHSGQVCISIQRIYAHEEIAGRFVERIAEEAGKLVLGHPLDESTDISSLITVSAAERVEAWMEEALQGGASRRTGGARRRATIPPAVLENVPAGARLSCQEVFGPVVAVARYRELDDAIARVNATPYGLQAGIFTRDLGKAFHAARRFEVGGVLINDIPTFRVDHMPYGGMKESGEGREGPRYAMEEMTELKLICWR